MAKKFGAFRESQIKSDEDLNKGREPHRVMQKDSTDGHEFEDVISDERYNYDGWERRMSDEQKRQSAERAFKIWVEEMRDYYKSRGFDFKVEEISVEEGIKELMNIINWSDAKEGGGGIQMGLINGRPVARTIYGGRWQEFRWCPVAENMLTEHGKKKFGIDEDKKASYAYPWELGLQLRDGDLLESQDISIPPEGLFIEERNFDARYRDRMYLDKVLTIFPDHCERSTWVKPEGDEE